MDQFSVSFIPGRAVFCLQRFCSIWCFSKHSHDTQATEHLLGLLCTLFDVAIAYIYGVQAERLRIDQGLGPWAKDTQRYGKAWLALK